MKIEYDKTIDAKYVRIKKGKVAYTKKEQDWLLLDCSEEGNVLGIEILDASKHTVTLQTVLGVFCGYSTSTYLYNNKKSENIEMTINSPKYEASNRPILV